MAGRFSLHGCFDQTSGPTAEYYLTHKSHCESHKIYEILKKEKVDYIIHCGDICHTKTQISPEYVEMTSNFLFNLAEIAPTYIILGNHDGNLKNSSRQDAITPIIDALEQIPDKNQRQQRGTRGSPRCNIPANLVVGESSAAMCVTTNGPRLRPCPAS